MARVAFFTVPLHGHVNPTLPLVRELVERGDEVDYYITDAFRAQVERAGARVHRYTSTVEGPRKEGAGPLPVLMPAESREVLPQLLEAVRARRPDYVVHDFACLWGQLIADALDLPAVAFHPTLVLFSERGPARALLLQQLARFSAQFEQAARDVIALTREYGQPQRDLLGLLGRHRPLNLVCVPREFQPGGEAFDESYCFVGHSIGPREDTGDLPLEHLEKHLEGGPVLYISLGTVFNNWPDFYRMCFAAFGDTPWRVVLGTGHAVDPSALGRVPDNFLVRPTVPQLEVLERASLFITHGGANSLMESFAHGVPVVVIPQMAEQPLNALRVAELGAGVALRKETVTGERLREAAAHVAGEPGFLQRARELQGEVLAAGGYRRAAEALVSFGREALRARTGARAALG